MSTQPTYSKTLDKIDAEKALRQLGAKVLRRIDVEATILYTIRGGGQARAIDVGGGKFKVQAYAGACPCDK